MSDERNFFVSWSDQVIDNAIAQALEWQRRPLCCRYLLVLFETLTTRVREEGVVRELTVHWVLGVLADGQCEVLGVWLEPVSGVMNWKLVFDDLKARGVERVRFVATTEPTVVRAAHPGTTVLPSVGQLLRQGLAKMAPRGTAQAARAALANLSASP